jgi:hypothetical protein
MDDSVSDSDNNNFSITNNTNSYSCLTNQRIKLIKDH